MSGILSVNSLPYSLSQSLRKSISNLGNSFTLSHSQRWRRNTLAVESKIGNSGKIEMVFGRIIDGFKGQSSIASVNFEELVSVSPPIEKLEEILADTGYGEPVFRLAHTSERLFGTDEEPRLIFYRDNSSWCPYCERVWLQLEEKQVPYKVEKINMRCYGPKPDWYTKMVPSGLLPAIKIDGKLVTESLDIMFVIESTFSDYKPLLPQRSTKEFQEIPYFLQLERKFMGAWLRLITNPGGDLRNFEKILDETNSSLEKFDGPYFLGTEFSLVDAVWAPFLERAAASVPYWKGLNFRRIGKWPALDQWFDAMDKRPTYQVIKSDDFTVTHCLEPQIGRCYSSPAGESYRALVDGTNGSWDLPLGPETTAWGFDDGTGNGGAKEEAAKSLVSNHDAVVGFALRGVSNGERYREAVSAGFRLVALALLKGVDSIGPLPSKIPLEVAVAAAYLRDKVGVPRDLTYPAARQFRAHLNWLIKLAK